MKWFLILWAAPLTLLGAWYGLSYNDIHFGIFILTREAHDLVFQIYSQVLGIPAEDLPPLILRALIVDTGLVAAILAFRRRAAIRSWWNARRGSGHGVIDESLSRAP